MNFFQTEDVGTRYDHYRELLDLYEATADLIRRQHYLSAHEKGRLAELEASIFMLRKQIDVLTGYETEEYSMTQMKLRRMVNDIQPIPQEE